MVKPLRHRQTKEAATDMFYLPPPRHISTLPHGKPSRTTKILSHARRRGSGVAARGARAASGDAGGRVPRRRIARQLLGASARISSGPQRHRLCRGRERLRRQVAVIAAVSNMVALEVKATTTTIPIVFFSGEDPVRLGLVSSLARPSGNLTGINFYSGELTAKRLELLRELVPAATRVAVLVNPTNVVTTE